MNFTWVPFYRELVGKVLEFEDKQGELIEILQEMQKAGLMTLPLEDDLSKTERVAFTEIDPFTFIANFSRTADAEASKQCEWLRQKWNLQQTAPTEFNGRANVFPQGGASWFFSSTHRGRQSQDIPMLWKIAKAVYGDGINALNEDLYRSGVKIANVGVRKLTTGFFWLRPSEFVPLVGPTLPYLKSLGVEWDEKLLLDKVQCTFSEYLALIEKARSINPDFVSLSYNAWLSSKNKTSIGFSEKPQITDSVVPTGKNIEMPTIPLNQILYGPPGTGKTFNSIIKAVEIIKGEIVDEKDEEAVNQTKARFKKLSDEGQIGFVTFHQSFSYEEFIEGLRPVVKKSSEDDENSGGIVRYEIWDGVLKKMVLQATEAVYLSTQSHRPSFDELWQLFLSSLQTNDVIAGLGRGRYKISIGDRYAKGDNIAGNASSEYTVSIANLRELWEKLPFNKRPDSETLRAILGKGFACNLAGAIFLSLQTIEAKSFPVLTKQLDFQNAPRYVLIIDEINRGNISKIFGELITLLEEDKRIGAENELRLTLPTSGETFALPPNLYILGTMNTSDKSLAQLDVALRRRFSFVEMPPRLELCDKLEGQVEVLRELNNRLEWALDREHRLGHAYFMNVDSEAAFNEKFESQIVPLLIEYFPHDFQMLRAVLGEKENSFLHDMDKPLGFAGSGKKYQWWFERGIKDFSAYATLRANYGL